jgi:hypothetical protein
MKKFWFKRKLYGWGWYPATWQGWLILLIYVVIFVKMFILFDINSHSESDTLIGLVLPAFVLTGILIFICYKTGETPKWQWGKRVE